MEAKKNTKRKNRKIKFSEDQYVQQVYMQGTKAVIPIELKDSNELYMKHDYLKMEMSDSVCKYIEEIAYMIPIDTEIELEIHCPRVNEKKQIEMSRAIKVNYAGEIDDIDYDMNAARKKSITLLIFGIILLVTNILTDKYIGDVVSNFLCVVWWVAIWDVIEMIIFDTGENREKRLNYQQLYDAKITFVFDDEDKDDK